MLWLRTLLFTILVPGTELVLIPLVVVARGLGPRIGLDPARYAGLVPLAVGLGVIVRCFADFIRRGRGTPAIYDPPRELVVAGLYRYVRNPQYVSVVLAVIGEALLSGRVALFGYAAFMAIGYHLFVRYYEEPTLGRLFRERTPATARRCRDGCRGGEQRCLSQTDLPQWDKPETRNQKQIRRAKRRSAEKPPEMMRAIKRIAMAVDRGL